MFKPVEFIGSVLVGLDVLREIPENSSNCAASAQRHRVELRPEYEFVIRNKKHLLSRGGVGLVSPLSLLKPHKLSQFQEPRWGLQTDKLYLLLCTYGT